MTETKPDGLLVLDKPTGLTSRAAVDHVQRWFPRRTRIGHTGTLDPLATGVLVLCIGSATRLTEYVQAMSKTYRSRFRLGARSDTDDADGTITPVVVANPPDRNALETQLHAFVGVIDQVPASYSAAKIKGQRAYDLARRGEEVALAPRQVRIYAIDILHYEYPVLDVEVHCGKGTYIRSLARDLGERLGCGAFVETLRRMRVGPFTVENAVTLDNEPDEARARLLPLEHAVAELPHVSLSPAECQRLCQGQAVPLVEMPTGQGNELMGNNVAVFDDSHHLLAVARYNKKQGQLEPVKVLLKC
jgi:tRNA pseudouridine55 synthase